MISPRKQLLLAHIQGKLVADKFFTFGVRLWPISQAADTQLRRLATDPTALAAAERLRGEAMRNPHMLAMLRDQEHRIAADPRLSQTMARMQRVLEAPHEPLPAAADDGLPTPHMSLDDLLGDDAKRRQLRALAERASARPRCASGWRRCCATRACSSGCAACRPT